VLTVLGHRLDALPDAVRDTKQFPLGRYRGLDFGVVLHSGGAADVFLEGKVLRHGMLSRDHRGPRAVLNALDRLASSYSQQVETARQELMIAEGQRRDHEARIGRAFLHDAYMRELTDLRDQLKAGLSQATPEPGSPSVAELAERIKTLKAAHTIEAAPERTAPRRVAAETPVTARIRRKTETDAETQPPAEPVAGPASQQTPPQAIATASLAAEAAPPASVEAEVAVPSIIELPAQPKREPAYQQHVTRGRKQPTRQLSLF